MQRIQSREVFEGEFSLPGDKSITHRAVMFNASADGEAVIQNALMGEDCLSTCECMRTLGATVKVDGTSIYVKGAPAFQSNVSLNCGNSGDVLVVKTPPHCGQSFASPIKST